MTTAVLSQKQRMKEEAIKAASESVREVYRIQQRRAQAGEIPYDPQRRLRVWFRPEVGGGYTAELRPVVVDSLKEAQDQGADYWDINRGWILRGRKPEVDYGQFVRPASPEAEPAEE